MLIDGEVIEPGNQNFTFESVKKYRTENDINVRIVDNFSSGDWFIRCQRRVRELYEDPEVCVLAIILSFDETTLTGGTGGSARTSTPIYVSLGNINLSDGKLPVKAIQCLGFSPEIPVRNSKV